MKHQHIVQDLQKQIRNSGSALLSLKRPYGHSNTTRTKSYNSSTYAITAPPLDQILHVDTTNLIVKVQPQMTMETLIKALLPLGYTIPVVPEFKGITVGGAIMGAAAESKSFQWGIFSDQCIQCELLLGNGDLITASPTENADIFYALPGSYGSLGLLVSADLKLIKAQKFVNVQMIPFSNFDELITALRKPPSVDYMDAIVLSKNYALLVLGTLSLEPAFPLISDTPFSPWFYERSGSFTMTLEDYLFRLDKGAFWMGAYLLDLPLLFHFLTQGVFKIVKSRPFSRKQRQKFHKLQPPNTFQRALTHTQMPSQKLWKLLHKAEKWIQDRFIIQDFCIPESQALDFLNNAINTSDIFPIWICPIKGTKTPQIFAPHLQSKEENFINVGIYGMPFSEKTVADLTRELEKRTKKSLGRKVLYSRSYYTEEEFWTIYPKQAYCDLRKKTCAIGKWPEITAKVLNA